MKRSIAVILLVLQFFASRSFAQEKYWIYFNSKTGEPLKENNTDIKKTQRDLPLYTPFLEELKEIDVQVIIRSKWLNAITAYLQPEQITKISALPFVSAVEVCRQLAAPASLNGDKKEVLEAYSTVLKQVKAEALVKNGLTGEGVNIGIIDGGFMDANESVYLDDIFYEDNFKAYRDFTGDFPNAFEGQKNNNDDHGTRVWRNIGGYDREKDAYSGIAGSSEYYLAKSDRGDREFRGEEDYWIAAVEWMDSLGIKIVNSSLGYSTGFDNPLENYDPLQIDGHSSPITQAAEIAASEKGILLVLSAGNDGNKDFQFLSVPADAQNVLSVGSCTTGSPKKMSYSSIGSPLTPYVKPEICCYALGGTSFSAPIITGMAAAMLQYDPELLNNEIIDLIKKSSHLYPYANNYIGYGVPNGEKILMLLEDRNAKVWDNKEMEVAGDLLALPAKNVEKVTVFHKKNEFLVLIQDEVKADNGEFIIARPAGVKRSTLEIGGTSFEIFWQ